MSTKIIEAFSKNQKNAEGQTEGLNVSEFFCDTIQGEGRWIGYPAVFLRLQNCTLNCIWCDTTEVWRHGDFYTMEHLFLLMEQNNVITKLESGHHLVLTGGSPLKQQLSLIEFFIKFQNRYQFVPMAEIENECTLTVHPVLADYIQCWNNSPKLSNSGNSRKARYKPHIISQLAELSNSWFKFVVDCEEDWQEIQMDYLDLKLIKKRQIILMPKGATRVELEQNREMVAEMAIRHSVRYCTREHIVLWDKQTGV